MSKLNGGINQFRYDGMSLFLVNINKNVGKNIIRGSQRRAMKGGRGG